MHVKNLARKKIIILQPPNANVFPHLTTPAFGHPSFARRGISSHAQWLTPLLAKEGWPTASGLAAGVVRTQTASAVADFPGVVITSL